MAVILNASTSSGFVQSADTSGVVQIQSNGTTELTVESTGVTVADNLLFNSGYGSSAVGYGCRAWVNFNGTGTVAIRASGNVSSVTDNGNGDYTVNFTTAMPDANYNVVGMCNGTAGTGFGLVSVFDAGTAGGGTNQSTTAVRIRSIVSSSTTDVSYINISTFR
jgi:uncharacterized protein (AIM24 family)